MDKTQTKNLFFTIMTLLILGGIIAIIYLGKNIQSIVLWVGIIIIFIYLLFRFKIILTLKDFERAVVYRFGKVRRVGGPGWTFVWPLIEKPVIVTLRVETMDIPPQRVLTKDNIELTIDGVLFISIADNKESVVNSVVKVADYRKAATMYVIAVLRDVVGEFELTEVITNIEKINSKLVESLAEVSKDWGIKVTSVEISEIKIPDEILQAMHHQKAAVQKKLAVYEMAESEKAKIMAVKDATDQLSEKTVVYYYMQALEKMAQGQSSKIIFPMELTNLLGKVSHNILNSSKEQITEDKLEKGISEEQLKKFLPLIQGYINKNATPSPKKKATKKKKKSK